VQTQTHRPLLKAPDPVGKIRELLAERDRFYRQATVYINTGPRSPREVAKKILFEFGLLNK
jgi:shikimate kinase